MENNTPAFAIYTAGPQPKLVPVNINNGCLYGNRSNHSNKLYDCCGFNRCKAAFSNHFFAFLPSYRYTLCAQALKFQPTAYLHWADFARDSTRCRIKAFFGKYHRVIAVPSRSATASKSQ